jgi:hypothetical protein
MAENHIGMLKCDPGWFGRWGPNSDHQNLQTLTLYFNLKCLMYQTMERRHASQRRIFVVATCESHKTDCLIRGTLPFHTYASINTETENNHFDHSLQI